MKWKTMFLLLAQQTMPAFDGMYWINPVIAGAAHPRAAILLVGGIFYLRAVIVPSPAAAGATNVDQKFGGLRAKWAMWVGIATALLIVTGTSGISCNTFETTRLPPSYHMVFTSQIPRRTGAVRARRPRCRPNGRRRSRPRENADVGGNLSRSRRAHGCHWKHDANDPPQPKNRRRPTSHTRRAGQPSSHQLITNDLRLTTSATMDKKAQKRVEVLRKKIAELQPRLAHASRWTTPTKSATRSRTRRRRSRTRKTQILIKPRPVVVLISQR